MKKEKERIKELESALQVLIGIVEKQNPNLTLQKFKNLIEKEELVKPRSLRFWDKRSRIR